MAQIVTPLVVSVPDAAILLGVCKNTVWNLIATRELESVMVGQSRKIRVSEIERYLKANTIPARNIPARKVS